MYIYMYIYIYIYICKYVYINIHKFVLIYIYKYTKARDHTTRTSPSRRSCNMVHLWHRSKFNWVYEGCTYQELPPKGCLQTRPLTGRPDVATVMNGRVRMVFQLSRRKLRLLLLHKSCHHRLCRQTQCQTHMFIKFEDRLFYLHRKQNIQWQCVRQSLHRVLVLQFQSHQWSHGWTSPLHSEPNLPMRKHCH